MVHSDIYLKSYFNWGISGMLILLDFLQSNPANRLSNDIFIFKLLIIHIVLYFFKLTENFNLKMDAMIFATGGYDEKVVLWDVVAEYTKRVIPIKGQIINALVVSPDKRYLAVAAHKTLKLYDLTTTSNQPVINYDEHTTNILSLGF